MKERRATISFVGHLRRFKRLAGKVVQPFLVADTTEWWYLMQTAAPQCERCGRVARFCFAGTGGIPTPRCWHHAVLYRPVFRRALQVAAIVGTILFVINQLGVVLSGMVTALVVLRIALTYLVPFLVSTYSALNINRLHAVKPMRNEPPGATPAATA